VVSLLRDAHFNNHACTADLVQHTSEILNAFARHPQSFQSSMEWANDCMKQKYMQDVKDLSQKANGWHFRALYASEDQLKDFRIEDMARDMQRLALELWDLLGLMLSADRNVGWQQKAAYPLFGTEDPTKSLWHKGQFRWSI
jgi:hypothetical protein